MCEKYGWEQGSVVDYASKKPFDLVICQGVLPYLDKADAKRALLNLASLCSGALYLEAVTSDDVDAGVIDTKRTDASMQLRPGSFYKRALAPYFQHVGGGVWLSRRANAVLYHLEQP
ncbi:MAG: methyltransferase type 11, partial [Polyangiales bacterium]